VSTPLVRVENINITKCDFDNIAQPANYDGTVTLIAEYESVKIRYEFKFSGMTIIDEAVSNAAKRLATSLGVLAQAVGGFRPAP
jgi:hypothetical protein